MLFGLSDNGPQTLCRQKKTVLKVDKNRKEVRYSRQEIVILPLLLSHGRLQNKLTKNMS